eukprot:TRINITY_DN28962_c0_g1_i1.p1 TRINITY_DN28962_c0_g1~~TRINITY_DN28962_c0_g1_i1.p1  ORF type:complete len:103 (-),score=11.92 TRINITY_DN28962_c0_g1_i1:134-442(-)
MLRSLVGSEMCIRDSLPHLPYLRRIYHGLYLHIVASTTITPFTSTCYPLHYYNGLPAVCKGPHTKHIHNTLVTLTRTHISNSYALTPAVSYTHLTLPTKRIV